MAKSDSFHCSVITPERSVLDCDATSVVFPAHDGEMGILRDRAPLVCKLGIGALRVDAADGDKVLFVDGGFVQMLDNHLTILTAQAKSSKELNAPAAEKAIHEAQSMKVGDDASLKKRTEAVNRAKTQLKLARQGT